MIQQELNPEGVIDLQIKQKFNKNYTSKPFSLPLINYFIYKTSKNAYLNLRVNYDKEKKDFSYFLESNSK